MWFSSLEFLFFFFPIVIGINYILPHKARNYWLLAASLFFYAWGEPGFFFLLILSMIVSYVFGLLIDRSGRNGPGDPENGSPKGRSRVLFALALLLDLLPLIGFKYLNGQIIGAILSVFPDFRELIGTGSFILPLAISFYTFQSVGYVFDVYRGMPAEKDPCKYALFIAFFPQLLQGPIIRYKDFRPQLGVRKFSLDTFTDGVVRFLTGFNQKILIANILSEAVDAAFGAKKLSVGMAWFGMLVYALQLYFDFSGYSDMAVGLGKMFGFRIAENFDFPFISKSVGELWRRWHITLGAWFRDYLYFPLGGSRVGSNARLALNLMIVWLATGMWHGSAFPFILWGVFNGVYIIFEKLTDLPEKISGKPVLQLLYRGWVIFFFMFGCLIFRSADVPQALTYIKALFRLDGNAWRDSLFKFNSREYILTFGFALLCAFPVCKKLRERISGISPAAASAVRLVWYLIQLLLAVVSVSCLVMSSHDPFLYANF